MPRSAFAFLFSGGSLRAFENHSDKFEIAGDSVSVKPAFIGYFVGTDGTMEACTDSKRRKSFPHEVLPQVADWMLCRRGRPAYLEGTEVAGRFSSHS